MAKQFSHVLFDWDGCLADTLPIWQSSIRKAFNEQNVEISDHDLVRYILPHLSESTKYGIQNLDLFVKTVLVEGSGNIHQTPLHQNAASTLQNLKTQKKQLSLVTSSSKDWIHQSLLHHKIDMHFDIVLTREDVSQTKPHPEMIHKAIELMSSTNDSSIVIGDSEADILAGKAAGITTVLFYPQANELFYPYETIKEFNPDHIIREFGELSTIVG